MADKTALDPRVPLLLLLSLTTGLVDAASVLGLGKVFTANMTGNVVFLGFAAAGTPGFHWPLFVAAIVSFMIGALIAGRISKADAGRSERGWLLTAALVECTLLWVAAAIALGFDVATRTSTPRLYAIIALTGLAMGFRNATIRQLKVPDLTTTVLTLTITGIAADSTLAGGGNPNWARRIGSIAAIFGGAALGALLIIRTGSLVVPLTLAGALVLVGTALCAVIPSPLAPPKS
jgi:uncharacterized membrane protein YoaK (UPF0700 family)